MKVLLAVDRYVIWFFFFFFQLEAGTSEKVCLVSRDEQSVLVVSYRDLKTCFEGAFNEILSASLT